MVEFSEVATATDEGIPNAPMTANIPPLIAPVRLAGYGIALEPLEARHLPGLALAAADPRIWRHMTSDLRAEGALDAWLAEAQSAQQTGDQLPFAIIRCEDGAVLGSTRYLNIAWAHRRLEIGWTWLTPDVWGGVINPACKLLLMGHAFDTLQAHRVEFRTDALNTHSRAAIAKLGAREEGILRRHMVVAEGRVRDTVQFAVIDTEWPDVKARLAARIAALKPN
jgi:RimJ/RimL family protein N-acetyltransferase